MSGVGSLSEYDSKIAMTNALKPYHEIHIAMLPALVNNYNTINLVQYLKRIGQEFGPPKLSQFKAKSNRLSKENSVPSNKITDSKGNRKEETCETIPLSEITCHKCGKKGHYASKCTLQKLWKHKGNIHVVENYSNSEESEEELEKDIAE